MIRKLILGMSFLLLAGCVEPEGGVSRNASPEDVTGIYKISSVVISIAEKAISHEGAIKALGHYEKEPGAIIKPYYARGLHKIVVPAFTGKTPVVLHAEIIYAQLPKQGSRMALGQQAIFRVRVMLKDPTTEELYKKIFASGGDNSTASNLGGLVGRAIERAAKGKQSDEERLQAIAQKLSDVTLYRFRYGLQLD